MSLTNAKIQEVVLYGKALDGDEDDLTRSKMARKTYLKAKMRPRLAAVIGDYGDNITDATRAIVLGDAIALGLVTDEAVVDGYKNYISAMLEGYGGAEAILGTLGNVANGLQQQLVNGYYKAAQEIEAAKTEDEVRTVDLPGEPVLDDAVSASRER